LCAFASFVAGRIVFFLTILLSSTIQNLARRHHATNRVNAASLFFFSGYVKKKQKRKKRKKRKRKRKDRTREQTKKGERIQKKENLFDHATNRVNTASLFFSFGYVKKQKQKKEKKKRKRKRKDRTREQTKKRKELVDSSRSF
jgi:hypothetical protein